MVVPCMTLSTRNITNQVKTKDYNGQYRSLKVTQVLVNLIACISITVTY